MEKYDIGILGGGPGGYVAAIRAAQLGLKTAVIEKDVVGGTCLNRGCIPTKAYLKHTELIHELKRMDEFGIMVDGYSLDWKKMRERKNKVVSKLTGGIRGLFKKNGVDLIKGMGEVINEHEIKITGEKDSKIWVENIIIATGSAPIMPGLKGIDLPDVISSKEALDLDELPERIVIIGGGVIGVEMASIYSSLEVDVTIVEILDDILINFDKEMVKILKKSLKKHGVKLMTSSKVTEIAEQDDELIVKIESEKADQIATDKVLAAVGRKPVFSGIENLNLERENGFIKVDAHMETSTAGIYAVGDVTGGMLLAHEASAEGIVAVKNIVGEQELRDNLIPNCVYSLPEIASVGMTEAEAKKEGYEIKVGRFPFMASGKAIAIGSEEGFVKIIADKKWDQILGAQIIGPHATDLIAEAAIAIKLESTAEILANTIHAHPTLSESVMEAAEDVNDLAVHF
ncbi:dihydrolipoyl dehydrogenase [Halanaerobium hydrogeniformans]|uniref:Dihydrolipoyl dehydrogenase n=1 Tax=Halanaerobium hydrogeniformans TaxID=656519 RepID=E4RNX7_HALHG|nr:dihydrolipoyl dehydrogenase [Halanaerobium hydrogeniformans]ADQ13667.1 dihydrolipoamide dehydrogenase [Halanaerobium hydrogeniformans]